MKKSSLRAQKRKRTVWQRISIWNLEAGFGAWVGALVWHDILGWCSTGARSYSCWNLPSYGSGLGRPWLMWRTCGYSDWLDPS
jgi:hypothetical protein